MRAPGSVSQATVRLTEVDCWHNDDTSGAHQTPPAPVLALTIVDCQDGSASHGKVLVAVRDAATNVTHPNVVSVPTQRMPELLARSLAPSDDWCDSDRQSGHCPLVFAAEALLARKLALGDALESGQVGFEVRVGTTLTGSAEYGRGITEPIEMTNLVLRVVRGVECFPRRTSSYSDVQWSDPGTLVAAFRSKNALLAVPAGDPLELCIHGLCVSSTVELIGAGAVGSALVKN
jgi:hypothetical protein